MSGLAGKVVLITGASSGIGYKTSLEFAKAGSKLAICGRNAENLAKTAKECKELGVPEENVLELLGDVTVEADCERLVADTIKQYGQLDVLCNIAGGLKTMRFFNCSTEDFIFHFNLNVLSTFMMCKFAFPKLYETQGVCINMGALAGVRAYNTVFPYSVAKGAVDHMSKCLALEAGPKGVRVLTVDPGGTPDTDLMRRSGIATTEEKRQAHNAKSWPLYPLQRLCTSDEVAKVIVWTASDAAGYITGVNIPIDGGMSCMSQHMM